MWLFATTLCFIWKFIRVNDFGFLLLWLKWFLNLLKFSSFFTFCHVWSINNLLNLFLCLCHSLICVKFLTSKSFSLLLCSWKLLELFKLFLYFLDFLRRNWSLWLIIFTFVGNEPGREVVFIVVLFKEVLWISRFF